MSLIITGTNGFLGNPLASFLHQKGENVLGIQRQNNQNSYPTQILPDYFESQKWDEFLEGKKTFIHCAARAHQMSDKKNEITKQLYLHQNHELTQFLAQKAAQHKLDHFIFISSVAAFPFDPNEIPSKKSLILKERWSFYGESKFLAESALKKIESESNMKVTILRPPLIYGPNVKGNLATLIRIAQKGIPLPFKSIRSQKSMISIDNFSDLIHKLTQKKEAWGHTYFVKDYDTELNLLLETIYTCLHTSSKLLPFPSSWLSLLSKAPFLGDKIDRFTQELVFDDSLLRKNLDWTPPFSFEDGIQKMVNSLL